MNEINHEVKPRLRSLDFQPVNYRGEQMWLLGDPWQISDRQIIFPQALAQMLLFCDGTLTAEEIHLALCAHLGGEVPFEAVENALIELDQSYLLHNERFEVERRRLLRDFRDQPYRPAALAGLSYPATARDLTAYFHQFGVDFQWGNDPSWQVRGIVSPHIDYQRGGPVYAEVWRRAAPAVLDANLVLIFGTDHSGRPGSVTLTRLPYATPYGILPTDPDLIDHLSAALGSEKAFAEELNHRNEHSVELSAVWLHHIYEESGAQPAPMIPILVGSFHHFLNNGAHPAGDATYNRFISALREHTRGRRLLVVGSVDLAHVGPAFGDPFEMNAGRRAVLRDQDNELMEAIIRGDSADFYRQIHSVRDRNRICGFAPLYLMLRYLETTSGTRLAYKHCPADPTDTSLVSICGLLLGND